MSEVIIQVAGELEQFLVSYYFSLVEGTALEHGEEYFSWCREGKPMRR